LFSILRLKQDIEAAICIYALILNRLPPPSHRTSITGFKYNASARRQTEALPNKSSSLMDVYGRTTTEYKTYKREIILFGEKTIWSSKYHDFGWFRFEIEMTQILWIMI
jgi:hypothetical protein